MTQEYRTNTQIFAGLSAEALGFYRQHGFVVLDNWLEIETIRRLEATFNGLIERLAAEVEEPLGDYVQMINQWRDLWKTEVVFKALLHDKHICGAAQFFMEEQSVQLLHDHVISKPCKVKKQQSQVNKQLPWHQDYPFWPVNTPDSLSLWVPFADVGVDGGCLEVIAESHKWGADTPVDFIMDDPERFKDRHDLLQVRIPVNKGGMVVLHSLTWHRSHPNYATGSRRLAYIPLWIPSYAQYTPDSRKWHPLNDNITVAVGETLNTDHFPRFGEYEEDSVAHQGQGSEVNEPKIRQGSMNMFEADVCIAEQIHQLLQNAGDQSGPGSLSSYVSDVESRNKIVALAVSHGLIEEQQKEDLETQLQDIHMSTLAYSKHRARNVFNSGYAGWWELVGKKLSGFQ